MNFSLMLKFFFFGFLINLGFFVIDFLWIAMLPRLNLSYGSIRPALSIFTFLRICIFFAWLFFQIIYCLRTGQNSMTCRWVLVIVNTILLFFALYSFYIEPFRLTVTKLQIPVQGLEKSVRIVQLSDIHVENNTPREKKIPGLVESLNPDMIVITGDLINESYVNRTFAINPLRELIDQLKAPLGIYVVNGNVEPPRWIQENLGDLDIIFLDDQVVRIPEISEKFVILGLTYDHWFDDLKDLEHLMKQTKTGDFSLLLYHKPDLAHEANDLGVDLYLTGHTHGGQVRLPIIGALFTNSRYGKEFEMGLYELDETRIFVSRGQGFTGGVAPRLRFLAPPEVVVIDLVPEK